AWSLREDLLDYVSTPMPAHLDLHQDWRQRVLDLQQNADADFVTISAVDMEHNRQHFLAGFEGGRLWAGLPPDMPAVPDRAGPVVITVLMQRHSLCFGIDAVNPVVRGHLKEEGIRRLCAIPINWRRDPPVGVIYLGWKREIDEQAE